MGPIYIMGRRHSGSTVLAVLLGAAPGIVSPGEIVTGLNGGPDEPTADGGTVATAPFWQRAAGLHRDRTGRNLCHDGAWLYRHSGIARLPAALMWSPSADRGTRARYAALNRALLDSLTAAADGRRILDSTKEYSRALMLVKADPSARVIHLIRNPGAVVASHHRRHRDGRRPVGFMKHHLRPGPFLFPLLMVTVGLGWTVGMFAAGLIKARAGGRVLDVSFDRLCAAPDRELRRIGAFLGEDLTDVIAAVTAGRSVPVGPMIAGNEMRFAGTVVFQPEAGGRHTAPAVYRWGVGVLAAPGRLLGAVLMRPG